MCQSVVYDEHLEVRYQDACATPNDDHPRMLFGHMFGNCCGNTLELLCSHAAHSVSNNDARNQPAFCTDMVLAWLDLRNTRVDVRVPLTFSILSAGAFLNSSTTAWSLNHSTCIALCSARLS